MAQALTGVRPADPRALLPVDAATHWFPAAVLARTRTTAAPRRCPDRSSGGGCGPAAVGAYLSAVDSAYMYQVPEAPLVAGFMAVYVAAGAALEAAAAAAAR